MEQELSIVRSDIAALQPHSCVSCQKLLIHNKLTYDNITGKFSYTEVVEMASSGCLLFQTLQTKFDRVSDSAFRKHHDLTLSSKLYTDYDILRGLICRWEMKLDNHRVTGFVDDEEEDILFAFIPEGN